LTVGFLAEFGEALGGAAGLFVVDSGSASVVDFGLPADVDEKRRLVDELLRRSAAATARDITGAHGNEVAGLAGRSSGAGGCGTNVGGALQRPGDSSRAEKVDLDGVVERGVEAHGRGGVDCEIAGREKREPIFVESNTVGAHIAANREHAAGAHLVERLGGFAGVDLCLGLFAESVESVVAKDVSIDTMLGASPAGPNNQNEFTLGGTAQESLDKRRTEKTGGARNCDSRLVQLFANHRCSIPTILVLSGLSTNW
jgi:hypothetical protein